MSRQSNKALEKFNTPTADSIARKQAKELVDDEYNDIRRQIIRRQFDQVNLYNEIFDLNKNETGDILVEYKLMELFRTYINQINESRRRLGENRQNPFNDLIGAYNAFTSSLSSYVTLAQKKNSKVDVSSFQNELRESATLLQQLLDYALAMVSGNAPPVPVSAAPAITAVEAPGLVAEREDRRQPAPGLTEVSTRRLPAYEDEHPDNPFLQDGAVQGAFNRALARRQQRQEDGAVQGAFNRALERRQARQGLRPEILDPNTGLPYEGQGKAHGGSLFAPRPGPQAQPARNQPPGPGRLIVHNRNTGSYVWRDMSARARGGYRAFGSRRPTTYTGGNTDMFWKFMLGAGEGGKVPDMLMLKPTIPRYPTENDILELFNLLKEVQRGFVPNQPFRGNDSMTDAEKARQKGQLGAFEGAEKELTRKRSRISDDFAKKYYEIIENPPTNNEELDNYVKELQEIVKKFLDEYSRAKFKEQGDYRPQEQQELRRIAKSHNKLIEALTKEYRFGNGKAHGGRKGHGLLKDLVKALNDRQKQLDEEKARKKGGQAGFSMEKTREIVDQWPGFPYFVPPASKTGPMLKNPRSRVNNRTEANGKPKRICKMDMSAASIACRKGEDPPKRRGRPKKESPKEGGRFGRLFTSARPRPRPRPQPAPQININPIIIEKKEQEQEGGRRFKMTKMPKRKPAVIRKSVSRPKSKPSKTKIKINTTNIGNNLDEINELRKELKEMKKEKEEEEEKEQSPKEGGKKKRGRPKKSSPKEGGRCIKRMGKTYCGLGKKKAKKSGKPKYDVI